MPIPNFKEILDGLPEKAPRSRLEPYRELILEMRRRGRPLREIARVLGEKCDVQVAPSTIHDFVRVARSTEQKKELNIKNSRQHDAIRTENPSGAGSDDEVNRRIAALKARKAPTPTGPGRFQFISGEPLRLPSKSDRRQSAATVSDENQ